MTASHEAVTVEQFTKQAEPFAALHTLRTDAEIIRLICEAARPQPGAAVLDVACGPGLVACALARVARHVTGLDLTPAMIEQAAARQRAAGLGNLTWVVGDAVPLPFPDGAFTAVVTRYSFHHLLDPRAALAEMARVCRPGGRVTVADVFTRSAEQAAAYDRLERWRDPSHTHALRLDELDGLFAAAGLADVRKVFYRYEVQVEELLARSFPVPGGAEEFRRAVEGDIGQDLLGIGATRRDGALRFAFPVVIISGVR
jgi:ubiquinone/menaquinone biosynthesis C-methylase UbiE